MIWKASDSTWQAEEARKAKAHGKSDKEKRGGEEGEDEEDEESSESVLNTTGDAALQEKFVPFGNECNYTEDENEDEESIGDIQEFPG